MKSVPMRESGELVTSVSIQSNGLMYGSVIVASAFVVAGRTTELQPDKV
jgi:hypothetical protein